MIFRYFPFFSLKFFVGLFTVVLVSCSSMEPVATPDVILLEDDSLDESQNVLENLSVDTKDSIERLEDSLEGLSENNVGLLPNEDVVPLVSVEVPSFISFEIPETLSIASINVNEAEIVEVGNEANGEFEVPAADKIGWWQYGSSVNQVGTMILAAHVDYNGEKGVFWDLQDVKSGDVIFVNETEYRVDSVRQLDKNIVPDDVFKSNVSHRLALVTCGGNFDRSLRSYEDNIIVLAYPVEN